jgi:hypothetical protein
MVTEQCFDLLSARCVQCGDVIDPVILRNRRLGLAMELKE